MWIKIFKHQYFKFAITFTWTETEDRMVSFEASEHLTILSEHFANNMKKIECNYANSCDGSFW